MEWWKTLTTDSAETQKIEKIELLGADVFIGSVPPSLSGVFINSFTWWTYSCDRSIRIAGDNRASRKWFWVNGNFFEDFSRWCFGAWIQRCYCKCIWKRIWGSKRECGQLTVSLVQFYWHFFLSILSHVMESFYSVRCLPGISQQIKNIVFYYSSGMMKVDSVVNCEFVNWIVGSQGER